ncbi:MULTISPECIES: endolytic transglycosylase MltG [Microbacterium]|uniref:Endolytic murein transglycosylase n=1 Tax=Microbacterium wangchenii TaxID=2541726 RepID=A0ABX5SUG1_9MICO|nr:MULTISPECIES: endolytic transglycosylase MltG [Microbacterium]MCK6065321.1 endolytic transglycosylase MltG [Microbacterium sp. EYE_512]QBR88768.1 endolytic transglycosylase MltG [Microbacterium wangchenii]
MPDTPSGFDDPFADLYGKLPDPNRRSTARDATPKSRREARAAQRRQNDTTAPREDTVPARVRESVPASDAERESEPAPVAARERESVGAAAGRSTGHGRSAPSATLDDLFSGERSTSDLGAPPPRPSRKRRRTAGWIAIVLALVGGVAAGGLWVWNTYEDGIRSFMGWEEPNDYEPGLAHGETTITIASGDTGGPVSQKLFDAGVTKTPEALYDYMIENSVTFTFQPGVYRLQLQMNAAAVLDTLADPASRMENTAQLREGLTAEQTLTALSEQLEMPLEELQAAAADPSAFGVPSDSLEGWLFPATYTFDPAATASDVIARLVARTVESLDQAGVPEADRQRVLTIASIVEREGRPNDFAKVSRVIQNRLDQGMKLQMDSTAQYGYGELHAGSASTSDEAQFDDNPWNTYVIDGLPAGPIANPGDAAIDAAMHPADGPWLFFVTVNLDTGETVFTTTADEHEAARQQWISWCKDNPGKGC